MTALAGLSTISRILLGNDVFISYARADGLAYARSLVAQLAAEPDSLSCDADFLWTVPSEETPLSVLKRLRRAGLLVVIATPAALRSQPVHEEFREFRAARPDAAIVVIFFERIPAGTEADDWVWRSSFLGLPPTFDPTPAASVTGDSEATAAAKVVAHVRSVRTFVRRTTRLRRLLTAAVAIFGALLGASALLSVRVARSQQTLSALQLAEESTQHRTGAEVDLKQSIRSALASLALRPSAEGRIALRAALDLLPPRTRTSRVPASYVWVNASGVVASRTVSGDHVQLSSGQILDGDATVAVGRSSVAYISQSSGTPAQVAIQFSDQRAPVDVLLPPQVWVEHLAISADGQIFALALKRFTNPHPDDDGTAAGVEIIDSYRKDRFHLPVRGDVDAIAFVDYEPFLAVAGHRRVANGAMLTFVELWPLAERGARRVNPVLRVSEPIFSIRAPTRLTLLVGVKNAVRVYEPDAFGVYTISRWIPSDLLPVSFALDAAGASLAVGACENPGKICEISHWALRSNPQSEVLWSLKPFLDFTYQGAGLASMVGKPDEGSDVEASENEIWQWPEGAGRPIVTPAPCSEGRVLKGIRSGALACAKGETLWRWTPDGKPEPATGSGFTRETRLVDQFALGLLNQDSGPVHIRNVNLPDGGSWTLGDTQEMRDFDFTPAARGLIRIRDDGTLSMWSFPENTDITPAWMDLVTGATFVRFSGDGKRILLAFPDRLEVLALPGGALERRVPLRYPPRTFDWNDCGILVATEARTIELWARSGDLLERFVVDGDVDKVALAPECSSAAASVRHGDPEFLLERANSLRRWQCDLQKLRTEGEARIPPGQAAR